MQFNINSIYCYKCKYKDKCMGMGLRRFTEFKCIIERKEFDKLYKKENEEEEKFICLEKVQDKYKDGQYNALYYSKKIGRRRIYRQSYPLKPKILDGKDITKGFKLFEYKNEKRAQELCDYINKIYNSNYEVRRITI